MEMVADYDYPIEQDFYRTKDGYLNKVFRISGPRGTKAKENAKSTVVKPVIIY